MRSGRRDILRDLRRLDGLRQVRDLGVLRKARDLRRLNGLRQVRDLGVLRNARDLRCLNFRRVLGRNGRGESGSRVEGRRLVGAETADRRDGRRRWLRLRRPGRGERKVVVFVKFFVLGVLEFDRRRRGGVKFFGLDDLERRRRGFVKGREGREIFGDAIFQIDEAVDESERRFDVKTRRFGKLRPDDRGGLSDLGVLRRQGVWGELIVLRRRGVLGDLEVLRRQGVLGDLDVLRRRGVLSDLDVLRRRGVLSD